MKSFRIKNTTSPQNSGESTIHQFISRLRNDLRKNATTKVRNISESVRITG